MNKSFIKLVYKELTSIFKSKPYMQQRKETQLIDYFGIVENYLLRAFQKIRSEYERD
ncbi:MAG TPA: hypothetical protein LFW21_03990 [Rickettsia endosymbiont of Pyrocoelia pectoralis]|nr:hypothetical protein [Rickettsia endosymbiont of Pyrocoelia pectoralis]